MPEAINVPVIHRTRIPGLSYINQARGLWRVVDTHDDRNDAYRTVGPQYKTKAELLADFDRYSREAWGYLP